MTQSGVSAFARIARGLATAAVLLVASAGALAAQGTGKVEGRVRDQAGAPIQNAQVIIVGTAFSALTNAQGYYFINNVPAGTISLRGSFIGYKRSEVAGVRVLAGQTITQDIQLEATRVQVEEITVVAADNPLVPRDEVTTKQRISGEFSEKLPVDRIAAVIQLQPGVVAAGGGLSIRGGRLDEAITYIDGVPVQSGNRRSPAGNVTVGTNAFEEISVTTGAASADLGNAQSGVINIVTRTGGSNYAARLAFETDEVFGKTTGIGFNRVEGNLSGPLTKNLTFALSGVLEGQRSGNFGKGIENYPFFQAVGDTIVDNAGTPTAVKNYAHYSGDCGRFDNSTNAGIAGNYGEDCNGSRRPFGNTSNYQAQANLNYTYGSGSRVRLSALLSQAQARGGNGVGAINLPGQIAFGNRTTNSVYTLNWTQNLSRSSERLLALDVALSYQSDKFRQMPLADGGPGEGFLGFYLKKMPLTLEDLEADEDRLTCFVFQTSDCIGPFDYNDLATIDALAQTAEFRSNPWGLFVQGTPDRGGATGQLRISNEDRYIGRANLDWQFDRYNRLKIGGEFTHYDITNYAVSNVSQRFNDFWIEDPQRAAVFIEDRLDLGDVVVQAGLRYDWYDSRSSRPFAQVDTTGDGIADLETFYPRSTTNPFLAPGQDPRELYRADQSHDYLSPRIQVAFPVTEKTNFRLSYAHAVQAPDFSLVFAGINTDRAFTNTNQTWGSDLDFGKTITFEFGIRHAFNDDMVLDLAAYNRDNLANTAGRFSFEYDPFSRKIERIQRITNQDFGTTRGLDLRLDRRFGNLFNGTIAYSFTDAKNTGNDPFAYLNFGARVVNSVSGGNQPPPQAIAPLANARPHSVSGALALTFPNDWRQGTAIGSILENFNVFASFRYASGTAYSDCPFGGNQGVLSGGACASGGGEGGLNTERLPALKQLDMRFVKGFKLGGNDLSVYLDARNLLNFTNVNQVFVETKQITSPLDRDLFQRNRFNELRPEATANGRLAGDNSIRLPTVAGCGGWVDQRGDAAVPNCVSLVRAEERWGNGDGVYTVEEQLRAINEYYDVTGGGTFNFWGAPRRMRLGVEINF